MKEFLIILQLLSAFFAIALREEMLWAVSSFAGILTLVLKQDVVEDNKVLKSLMEVSRHTKTIEEKEVLLFTAQKLLNSEQYTQLFHHVYDTKTNHRENELLDRNSSTKPQH